MNLACFSVLWLFYVSAFTAYDSPIIHISRTDFTLKRGRFLLSKFRRNPWSSNPCVLSWPQRLPCALFHTAAFILSLRSFDAVNCEVHHICQKTARLSQSWSFNDSICCGLTASRGSRDDGRPAMLPVLCRNRYASYVVLITRLWWRTQYEREILHDGSSISWTISIISLAWSVELQRASVSPLGMFSCS